MKKLFAIVLASFLCLLLSAPIAEAKNSNVPPKSDLVKVTEYTRFDKGKWTQKRNQGKRQDGNLGELSPSFSYSGIHWRSPAVTYKVDASNSGLDPASTLSAVNASFNTWENEINSVGRPDTSIIDYTYNTSAVKTGGLVYDGENTVSWRPISASGVIAQTTYWYNRKTREIVEFDMVMNRSLQWATDGNASAFDIQNIATHEAGHTLVLNDLYKNGDNALTMYGYSRLGEISKRDLALGDCLGLEKIY